MDASPISIGDPLATSRMKEDMEKARTQKTMGRPAYSSTLANGMENDRCVMGMYCETRRQRPENRGQGTGNREGKEGKRESVCECE